MSRSAVGTTAFLRFEGPKDFFCVFTKPSGPTEEVPYLITAKNDQNSKANPST